MKTLQLGNRIVGPGHPCYVIAEIGSNHNRDFDTAKKMINVAKEAGCDAAKFQSYTADGIYSRFTPRISEMDGRSHDQEGPYELIKRIEMPLEWHTPLKEYCDEVGIEFCSTPFDESMVDLLEEVNVPFYKISSYEITHYPMLKKIAQTKKPVILSTGNSVMEDVHLAVKTLVEHGCKNYALLHCVSQYPANYEDVNIRAMESLRKEFDCVVGFSDHTTDSLSSALSISMGASIIEKHMTLDKTTFGPDHPFSLEPDELKELVSTIRSSELIMGDGVKRVCDSEQENHKIGRRSIIASNDIKSGDVVTEENLIIKRPALGIHPKHLSEVVGRKAKRDIKQDEWIVWDDIES